MACLVAIVLIIAAMGSLSFVMLKQRGLTVSADSEWAIGIYSGDSPCQLVDDERVRNPVLTRTDVRDVKAEFVADPFIFRVNSAWYMFFEIFDSLAVKGVIGVSESEDGLRWKYKGVVLREEFHLSYPYVFSADGAYYMIPEAQRRPQCGCTVRQSSRSNGNMLGIFLKGLFATTP